MITFAKLWETMESQGVSQYELREKYNVDSRTIRRLKTNDNITTATLNKLCNILDCKLSDVAEYIPDEKKSRLL